MVPDYNPVDDIAIRTEDNTQAEKPDSENSPAL